MLLTSYPTPQDYGAAGNGTTDDTTALNQALSTTFTTYGGGVVFMPSGSRYLVSGPISIPPFTFLMGQAEITLNLGTIPTSTPRIIVSSSWSPGSSTGIIQIASKTPGGWSTNTAACGVSNVYIDGSANANTNVQGVKLIGPVYDVHLDNVFIYKAGHNGVDASSQTESGITPTFPYHCRWWRTSVVNCANTGFNIVNFTDSVFDSCLAFGNTGVGWAIQNNSNTQFLGCRAEWNSQRGYNITGAAGSITFSGCSTDQNAYEGIRITAATGSATAGGGIIISGGKFNADGNSGTNSNGIKITGSTVPVIITGVNVEAGQDANNLNYYPGTGIEIDTSSNVTVTGSVFQGISASWTDGGGNTNVTRSNCFGFTGNPGSQTKAILPNVPTTNLLLPDDVGFITWTFPNTTIAGTGVPTSAGIVHLCRVNMRTWTTVTNVVLDVTNAPTLTTGNYAGLYNGSGTLMSATADQTTNWASSGVKTMALTSSQTVTPGIYYVAFLTNGSALPSFARANATTSAGLNAGTTSTTFLFGTFGTGLTTLPGSITLSSAVTEANPWWMALS